MSLYVEFLTVRMAVGLTRIAEEDSENRKIQLVWEMAQGIFQ
jgi:hypothetical protein